MRSLIFASFALLSVVGCERGTTTRVPSAPLTFGTEPVAVGEVAQVERRGTLSVEFRYLDGSIGGPITIQVELSNTHEARVKEVFDGLASAVEVGYVRAREYWGGTEGPIEEHVGVTGNRYLVYSDGGSLDTARADGGRIQSTREVEQLDRDFELLGSPGSLRAQLRGRTVEPGVAIEVTPAEISGLLPDADADLAKLTLVGLEQQCGREVAVFDATLRTTVWFRRAGARAELQGTLRADVATGQPMAFDFEGPVVMVDGENRSGAGATVEGKGKAALYATTTPSGCW